MKSDLKKDILIVLFFTAFVPTVVSLVLLLRNVGEQRAQLARLQTEAKQQARYALSLQMNQIERFAEVLIQSSEVSSFIHSPTLLRKYPETLLIGKVFEMSGQLADISNVALFSNGGNLLFKMNQNYLPPFSSKVGFVYKSGEPEIYYYKELLFDDQYQSSPSATPQGVLAIAIDKSRFLQTVPSVTGLNALPSTSNRADGISIEVRVEKARSGTVIIYIIAVALLLCGTLTLGIRHLLGRILTPYIQSIERSNKALMEQQKAIALSELARQVSHDIRSPLSALNLALSGVNEMPEEKRILIRNSVRRINDIANTLMNRKKQMDVMSVELIPALLDSLVSEKRTQYRDRSRVCINTDFRNTYDAFASVNPVEFKRVFSNLINNAVEATGEAGDILVSLRTFNSAISITVQDSGKGIPESILCDLGQKAVTWGKENSLSGSGLGVLHAKRAIDQMNGSLGFQSKIGEGTLVTVNLPKVEAPSWFVNKITLRHQDVVVVVDDDTSIHAVWQNRFQTSARPGLSFDIVYFSAPQNLRTWFKQNGQSANLILVDYEFLGADENGISLVEGLNIVDRAYLVTSRYDEVEVRERAAKLGLKIIPKTMASYIPITIVDDATEDAKYS